MDPLLALYSRSYGGWAWKDWTAVGTTWQEKGGTADILGHALNKLKCVIY